MARVAGGCGLPGLRTGLVAEPVEGLPLEVVELPAGASWFGGGGVRPVLAEAGGGGPAGSVLLEPLLREGGPRILVVNAHGIAVRVNDRVAPPVVLLKEGDRLSVSFGTIYEVDLFSEPSIGPVPAEFVGRCCHVCHVSFGPDQRVFMCPHCRYPLHLEDGPDDEVLKCAALVASCPACERPIRLAAGWLTEPWSGTAS